MLPEPRVFTRDNPCTKKDLWVCFRDERGFKKVQVAQAHAIIGVNAPRVMERNGYVVKETYRSAEWYALTFEGEQWLLRGIQSYIRNHPSERADIPFLEETARRRRVSGQRR
jgi:hypothetical protein